MAASLMTRRLRQAAHRGFAKGLGKSAAGIGNGLQHVLTCLRYQPMISIIGGQ
jgi:hypothetical protein